MRAQRHTAPGPRRRLAAAQGLRRRFAAASAIGLAAVALAGCGSSSKPAYCTDVTNFKKAVEQLKNDLTNPSALITQVQTVVSTGQTALTAVKTNFAPQTAAVKASVTALENTAKQLTSSSTRTAALIAIPAEVQAVVASGQDLANAAKAGKCG